VPIVHHSNEWGGEATCGSRGTGSATPAVELVNCARCLRDVAGAIRTTDNTQAATEEGSTD